MLIINYNNNKQPVFQNALYALLSLMVVLRCCFETGVAPGCVALGQYTHYKKLDYTTEATGSMIYLHIRADRLIRIDIGLLGNYNYKLAAVLFKCDDLSLSFSSLSLHLPPPTTCPDVITWSSPSAKDSCKYFISY